MKSDVNSLQSSDTKIKPIKNALVVRKINHLVGHSSTFFYTLKSKSNVWFYGIVMIPWLILATYLIFIKTPIYESSASLLFRQNLSDAPSSGTSSGLATLFNRGQHMAASSSSSSIILVQKYINSTDMLRALQESMDMKADFQSKEVDVFSRLKKNPNQQEFLDYYLKKVKVISDSTTGEVVIVVKAFSPEQAKEILTLIKEKAIHYFTKITHDSLIEQTQLAQSQLASAREKLMQAELALHSWRKKDKTIPMENSIAIEQKQLDLKFAKAEYEAAQQAFVIWNLATDHPTPVTTSPATLPDYFISPKLPNDLLSALFILTILYVLGRMVVVVVREHID